MNATEACIALNMLPTVGPVRLRRLLEVFKEPQQILAATRNELRKTEGIGSEVADQIGNWTQNHVDERDHAHIMPWPYVST